MTTKTPVESTITRALVLAAVDIEGINYDGLFDPPHANLESAFLPAVWAFTGPATAESADDFELVKRRFNLQVAVLPVSGSDPEQRETACRELLNRSIRFYSQYCRSQALDYVHTLTLAGDSGIALLPEYGYKFVGFQLMIDAVYMPAEIETA